MHQQHVARHARRFGDARLVVVEEVFRILRGEVGHAPGHRQVLVVADGRVGAAHLRSCGYRRPQDVGATEAGDVVPHHLQAIPGNREGHPAAVGEALQAIAALHQAGLQRTGLRRFVDEPRYRDAAMAGVDRHLVVGIALEHGLLSFRQPGLVLLQVLRGDGEQRLLSGVGVAEEAVGVHRGGVLAQAAAPGGNAAVGIPVFFRAERGEAATQPGDVRGGDGCLGAGGQQGKGERAEQLFCCLHGNGSS
ncbi:hypothetical protein D3C84_517810 [compost metagenome]